MVAEVKCPVSGQSQAGKVGAALQPLTLTRRQPDEGAVGAIWWREQRFLQGSHASPEGTPPGIAPAPGTLNSAQQAIHMDEDGQRIPVAMMRASIVDPVAERLAHMSATVREFRFIERVGIIAFPVDVDLTIFPGQRQAVLADGFVAEAAQHQGVVIRAIVFEEIAAMAVARIGENLQIIMDGDNRWIRGGLRDCDGLRNRACQRRLDVGDRLIAFDREGMRIGNGRRYAGGLGAGLDRIVVEGAGCRPVDLQRRLREVVEDVVVDLDIRAGIAGAAGATDGNAPCAVMNMVA